MLRFIRLLFSICLILIGLSFTFLNPTHVAINLYIRQVSLPIPVLILIVLAIGIFLGMFMSWLNGLAVRRRLRLANARISILEEEISNLRNLPIQDVH